MKENLNRLGDGLSLSGFFLEDKFASPFWVSEAEGHRNFEDPLGEGPAFKSLDWRHNLPNGDWMVGDETECTESNLGDVRQGTRWGLQGGVHEACCILSPVLFLFNKFLGQTP